jgi:hypothetical protein
MLKEEFPDTDNYTLFPTGRFKRKIFCSEVNENFVTSLLHLVSPQYDLYVFHMYVFF